MPDHCVFCVPHHFHCIENGCQEKTHYISVSPTWLILPRLMYCDIHINSQQWEISSLAKNLLQISDVMKAVYGVPGV